MKLVSQTVLPSLLPGQVINDMANPIQLVTLPVSNNWKDYNFSGFEIVMMESTPLSYIRVNFSNADDGFLLLPGQSCKIPSGFSGCRLFVGGISGVGRNVKIAIVKVPGIELPKSKPATAHYQGAVYASPVAGTTLINTNVLPKGIYDLVFWCAADSSFGGTFEILRGSDGRSHTFRHWTYNDTFEMLGEDVSDNETFYVNTSTTWNTTNVEVCIRATRVG